MAHNDLHIHMALDGLDFRRALAAHRDRPQDTILRARLQTYQAAGVTYLRDGGDRFGVCLRAKALAPEYGIVYRAPAFPIHKEGHYGGFLGRSYRTDQEYRALLLEAKRDGADFIKLMISGLMDFSRPGILTEDSLTADEIKTLAARAHDLGFSVMAHCNGALSTIAAVAANVESIEHGAYLNDEAISALAQSQTVWIPTLSAISNLIGCGRFPDAALRSILRGAQENVKRVAALGGQIGLGSDAGAYCVPHGRGADTEYQLLQEVFGTQTDSILQRAEQRIRAVF